MYTFLRIYVLGTIAKVPEYFNWHMSDEWLSEMRRRSGRA